MSDSIPKLRVTIHRGSKCGLVGENPETPETLFLKTAATDEQRAAHEARAAQLAEFKARLARERAQAAFAKTQPQGRC